MGNYFRQHPGTIALSVLLHGALAAALIVSIDFQGRAPQPAAQLAIQATVVDQKALQAMQQHDEPQQNDARPKQQEKEQAAEEAARKAREEKQKEVELEQLHAKREKAARLAEEKRKREAAEKKKREEAEAARKAEEKRKREAEQRRLAEEKRKREEEEKKRKAAAAARRQKELNDQLAADIAAEQRRRKAEQSGLLDQYVNLIRNRIQQQWIKPPSAHPGLKCVVDVQQIPDGTVVAVHVRADKCNGDAAVRRSIETAVLKASPLPKPPVPELFERNLVITFRPDEVG
jgi:colicin import membrane protein